MNHRLTLAALTVILLTGTVRAQAPWLPEAEQEQLRSLWPAGVPWPEKLKFYRLPAAAQKLVILNDADYCAFHNAATEENPANRQPPWNTPGGLNFSPRDTWRNATGLAIPAGKSIDVWFERVNVPFAERRLPQLRWAFPPGTVAIDFLIRRGQAEVCFEVRAREKDERGEWQEGVAYRPDVDDEAVREERYAWYGGELLRSRLNIERTTYRIKRMAIPQRQRFKIRRHVTVDESLTPPGYLGAGASCITCHRLAGQVTGYGTANRGGDTVLSWYPTRLEDVTRELIGHAPRVDSRWPVRGRK